MQIFKKFLIVFITLSVMFFCVCHPSATQIDIAEWNEHQEVFVIADSDVPSNSQLSDALLKVKYDYPAHRMRLFIMLKFNDFSEEGNPGVRFTLNDGNEVYFNLNGDLEYNKDMYHLEVLTHTTPASGVFAFEVVFGIKEGIPEQKIFTFVFYDPDGNPSNTYTTDITESESVNPEEQTANESNLTTTKNKPHKTETKTKTDKTKKTKAAETSSSTLTEKEEETLSKVEEDNSKTLSGNHKVLFISAAAIVSAGIVISGGMQLLKRKKHKGDES